MSRLEELITELCPNGVEYKKLSEILTIKNGKDYKEFNLGSIPVYGSGGIIAYIDTFVYDKPSVLLPRKGSIDKIYYVDTPFWTVDTIFYTVINRNTVLEKYVYYAIQVQHIEKLNTGGGVPSLTQSVLNKVKIPVPPLPVQEEIVRILDNFAELTAELTAELNKRKQQYQYYRDYLLTFDKRGATSQTDRQTDRQTAVSSVQWMNLGCVASISTGSSNTNEFIEDGKYPFYVRSQDVLRKNTWEFDETAIVTAGDGVGVGKVFHFVEGKYALHQRAYRIRITDSRILSKFFFYYMKANFLSYITKNAVHASVTSIRRHMLDNYLIPVPPLAEQAGIVSTLDRFDALCNDLTSGLPAEIEARKKQYEYYRDKLLTFKEAV